MKKFNKIVSTLLAALMLFSSFSVLAFAEEDVKASYEYDTNKQTLTYLNGQVIAKNEWGENKQANGVFEIQKYENTNIPIVVDTAQERIEYMDLRLEKDGYRLYIDAYSGEIAVENIATGETIFSNPYDVGTTKADDTIKEQLLSQVVVKYQDITQNNAENTFYSFTEAAKREQIDVRNIKNGIRVEYSIGREQAKVLVPMVIERSSFEKNILAPMTEALGEDDWYLERFKSFYLSIFAEKYDGESLEHYQKQYPLLKKMDFYIFDDRQKTDPKLAWAEQMIKTYAPDYTFDDLDEDHLLTGYESEDKNPPLFRMALEYTLTKDGLSVRLPANGIRFNETLYRLVSVDILPYMGAAANPGAGYSFFPDGSGTLFDFEKIQEAGATTTVTSKVYGQDFAYHTITGKHQEEIRYPVFGMVDTYEIVKETGNDFVQSDYPGVLPEDLPETAEKKRGFFAIIEEGDAMMEITSYHETTAHKYNSVKVTVYPRPQDTYNVADAISVSGVGGQWTVVSSRKYTGGYRIKYIMLTPDEVAREKQVSDTYDCSYVGMALAYRHYLIKKGILTKLTDEDVKKDIPLYIETFGTIPTIEKILSIPVTVMTPLATFEDVQTMYDDFATQGITNINFILTGYNDGGMYSGVAYDVDWERNVGGKKGFKNLVEYATEKGFGVYPDFDFAYHSNNTLFDGVTVRKHLVKTIDNRYANKREYSSTKQTHLSFFEVIISPAYFSRFYEHLTKDYKKFNPVGISVSTLGYSLNSDFDEDEPYNREDSKKFTVEAFEYLDKNYDSVMTSGGNAFAWKYVDHITDVALDSSRYAQAGASVPFLGMVLHGYVQLAGEPINMEGNIDYALLKAIESGASLKFILSYRNTENLKDFEDLSKYYSIRYDIWFDDVVSIYKELNSVLASVQTSAIVNHYFVNGTRVPDLDELISDADSIMAQAIARENEMLAAANDAGRAALLKARLSILDGYTALAETSANIDKLYDTFVNTEVTVSGQVSKVNRAERLETLLAAYEVLPGELAALEAELEVLKGEYDALKGESETPEAELEVVEAAIKALKAEIKALKIEAEANAEAIAAKEAEQAALEAVAEAITAKKAEVDAKQKEVDNKNKAIKTALSDIKKLVDEGYNAANKLFEAVDAFDIVAKNARAAYELLVADGSTNAELIAELEAKVEALETENERVSGLWAQVLETNAAIYAKAVAVNSAVQAYKVPVRQETVVEEDTTENVQNNVNKYASDDNKIAYVKYENGVAFLLNFNNYAVRAEFNGNVYLINAYDYIVVGSAK